MSRKSNGLAQENKKLNTRIEAFKQLTLRMDRGAKAILDIALMYGGHLKSCTFREALEATDENGVMYTSSAQPCTCQWAQAHAILSGANVGPPARDEEKAA